MNITNAHSYFVSNLLKWNKEGNNRQMPWKGEKDPYKIWLSEIILQQTRVDQGLEYYNRFVKAFPTVKHLAKAPETKVFKLWEGLGYYTRCKNLIVSAKFIHEKCGGKFPDQYEDIIQLKGIGPYTAAAISSFAFNLPHAVVDGNVFRVLARYFGIAVAIDSTEGKKLFTALANELLEKKQPGIYNQALMDFGAVICKPQLPLCTNCVLKLNCAALLQNSVQQLPVKEKSIVKTTRWLYYFVIEVEEEIYVRKRETKDIWENLYEFYLLETKEVTVLDTNAIKAVIGNTGFELLNISNFYRQLLTHQKIQGQFIRLKIDRKIELTGYKTVQKKTLAKLPFPKYISNYLTDKNVSLNLF